MSTTSDDLLAPVGYLDGPAMSGLLEQTAQEFADNLDAWLAIAVAEMTLASVPLDAYDRGQRAYAYYRAYDAVYTRLSSQPTSSSLTDAGVSESYSTQRDLVWKEKAQRSLLAWEAILGLATPTIRQNLTTTAVPTVISW